MHELQFFFLIHKKTMEHEENDTSVNMDESSLPPEDSASVTKQDVKEDKVTVKKWNAVAFWSYGEFDSTFWKIVITKPWIRY